MTATRPIPSGRELDPRTAPPSRDLPGRRAPRSSRELDKLADCLDLEPAWPDAAASLLARLGFRLLEADPAHCDESHLLVALRDRPTFSHFDPEAIAYYGPAPDGAAVATIDRRTPLRAPGGAEHRILWGHVHVLDRVPVENRFLTFGGTIRLAQVDPSLTVVDICSPAPIVRWGGHSQGTDGLAESIGAFFGRLIVPIDFMPGAARLVDGLAPGILYRAFLIDGLARRAAAARRDVAATELDIWRDAAWSRARTDATACEEARGLLARLEL